MDPARLADLHRRRASAAREQAEIDDAIAAEFDGVAVVPAPELPPAAPPANDQPPKRRRPVRQPWRPSGPVDDVTMRRVAAEMQRKGILALPLKR